MSLQLWDWSSPCWYFQQLRILAPLFPVFHSLEGLVVHTVSVCQLEKLISPSRAISVPVQWHSQSSRRFHVGLAIWRSLKLSGLATVQDTEYVSPPAPCAFLDKGCLNPMFLGVFSLYPPPILLPLLDSYSCSASDLSPAKLTCPSSLKSRQVVREWSRPHAARSLGFEHWLLWRGKSCVTKVRYIPCRIYIKSLVQQHEGRM